MPKIGFREVYHGIFCLLGNIHETLVGVHCCHYLGDTAERMRGEVVYPYAWSMCTHD